MKNDENGRETLKIAVNSKSGEEIDQHFGHAERFLIYEVGNGTLRQVAVVEVEKYCAFAPEAPMRHGRLGGILSALEGCSAIVTEMIGDYPRQELRKAGIDALCASGAIESALGDVHRKLMERHGGERGR